MDAPQQPNIGDLLGRKGVMVSGNFVFRSTETARDRAHRIDQEGKQADHRRFMEKAVYGLVSFVAGLAVIGCLGVIFMPGSSPLLKERAIGVLGGVVGSIIAAAFGFIAGKAQKSGGE